MAIASPMGRLDSIITTVIVGDLGCNKRVILRTETDLSVLHTANEGTGRW